MIFNKNRFSLNGYIFTGLILVLIFMSNGFAQSTRGLVNDGVDYYDDNKFSDAEVNFKKGLNNHQKVLKQNLT